MIFSKIDPVSLYDIISDQERLVKFKKFIADSGYEDLSNIITGIKVSKKTKLSYQFKQIEYLFNDIYTGKKKRAFDLILRFLDQLNVKFETQVEEGKIDKKQIMQQLFSTFGQFAKSQ